MARLFVAIDLPEALRPELARLRTEALEARWTAPEQYHLTLRFIGEADEPEVARIREALANVQVPPFLIEVGALGVFPSRRKPRVLVAEVEKNPGLIALQQQIEAVLGETGLTPEVRPFSPHFTLARFKRVQPKKVHAYLRAAHVDRLSFRPEAFHLYESVLTPNGAEHNVLASYHLL